MTMCGSLEGLIKEVAFELGLKGWCAFNRRQRKQLILGDQLMFANGTNDRHRDKMRLRNSKFSNLYLTASSP